MCRFLEAAGCLEVSKTLLAVPRAQKTHYSAPGSMSRLLGEANILETCECHPYYPGLHSWHDRTQTVQKTQSRGMALLLPESELEHGNTISYEENA